MKQIALSGFVNNIILYLILVINFTLFGLANASVPMIGVHISESNLPEYLNKIDKSAELNIKVIRIPLDWNVLEPSQNNYSINYINEVKKRLYHAQVKGQKVILMLGQSPSWANGNNDPTFPPTPAFYQSFANAMLYLHTALINPNDTYDIHNHSILAWEVWNEPNVVEFWGTQPVRVNTYVLVKLTAASEYAALLETCYITMKSSYAEVTILGGSLASGDTDYLEAMYNYWGGNAKFDHLSLHPYTRVDEEPGKNYGKSQYPDQCNPNDPLAPPWCYKKGVENIRALLDSKGDTEKQIWFTEFGTSSLDDWGHARSEAAQREHMSRALNILREWYYKDNDAMKIPIAIAYKLKDIGSDKFGLFRNNLSTKPVALEIKNRLDSYGKLVIDVDYSVLSILYMLLLE